MATKLYIQDRIDVWEKWRVVLGHKSISLPTPKTNYVDIPWADGSIDASTILTDGRVKYENRIIELEFTLANNEFINYMNGKCMSFYFSDDEEYEYTGRWVITDIGNNSGFMTCKFEITCTSPYKIQRDYTHIKFQCKGNQNIRLENEAMWINPEIYCSRNMQLVLRGEYFSLQKGRNFLNEIILNDGTNFLTFIGYGDVEIEYKTGRF